MQVAGAVLVAMTPSTALAHPPSDFLTVPVGQVATVMLPPVDAPQGRVRVVVRSTTPDYRIVSASGGPGWQSRVTPEAAFLDGRTTSALPVIITLTGQATRAGAIPIRVQTMSSTTTAPTHTITLTGIAGQVKPTARTSDAAAPNPAVLERTPPEPSYPWAWSVGLVALAALLLVRYPRRRPTRNDCGEVRSPLSDQRR